VATVISRVGAAYTTPLVLDVWGGDTDATLTVVDTDTGDSQSATVAQGDDRSTWTPSVPAWSTPGVRQLVWTVTGTGAGQWHVTVLVSASLLPAPGRSYATTGDLARWVDPLPVDARGRLERATMKIDELLRCAWYPVDDDGEPTEPDHQVALRDATCALVRWWGETGDDGTGAGRLWTSVSAGSISVTRANAGRPPSQEETYGSEVLTILAARGLLGHPPGQW